MLNRVCAPEMSFDSGECDNQPHAWPHAYVAYWEGAKESVPIEFVYEFPTLWRTEGWDDNKLFKVFWSPDENDSPAKMLRRVPEIPVYEKGSSLEKPGYYRAAVVKVKGMRPIFSVAISDKLTNLIPSRSALHRLRALVLFPLQRIPCFPLLTSSLLSLSWSCLFHLFIMFQLYQIHKVCLLKEYLTLIITFQNLSKNLNKTLIINEHLLV